MSDFKWFEHKEPGGSLKTKHESVQETGACLQLFVSRRLCRKMNHTP